MGNYPIETREILDGQEITRNKDFGDLTRAQRDCPNSSRSQTHEAQGNSGKTSRPRLCGIRGRVRRLGEIPGNPSSASAATVSHTPVKWASTTPRNARKRVRSLLWKATRLAGRLRLRQRGSVTSSTSWRRAARLGTQSGQGCDVTAAEDGPHGAGRQLMAASATPVPCGSLDVATGTTEECQGYFSPRSPIGRHMQMRWSTAGRSGVCETLRLVSSAAVLCASSAISGSGTLG